jgi:uncharacterized protein YidB (DUF937 family)
MDRRSLERLRLDRRLIRRRGWISKQELSAELEALPDATDKLTTLGEAAAARTRAAP